MKVQVVVLGLLTLVWGGNLQAQEKLRFQEWTSPAGRFKVDVPIPAPVRSNEQKMSDGSVYLSWTVPLSQEEGLIFGYLDLSKEVLAPNGIIPIWSSV